MKISEDTIIFLAAMATVCFIFYLFVSQFDVPSNKRLDKIEQKIECLAPNNQGTDTCVELLYGKDE